MMINEIKSIQVNCRHCHSKITDTKNLIDVKSTQSINSFHKEAFAKQEVLTHTFRNPSNNFFELVTAASTSLSCYDEAYETHTFFPGYAWSVCVCPMCGQHHGWLFTRIDKYCGTGELDRGTCGVQKQFYGLSVENLIDPEQKQEDKVEF